MATTRLWHFGPFALDPINGCLWQDGVLVRLPPKPFVVLAYMVMHAGQVVTKETLMEEAWPATAVSDGLLKSCINQIRKTLGDTTDTSKDIATVHRRGYRFVAAMSTFDPSPADAIADLPPRAIAPESLRTLSALRRSPGPVVMREAELHEEANKAVAKEHLSTFLMAYNFAKRLKTLKGLTPYEYIFECCQKEPEP